MYSTSSQQGSSSFGYARHVSIGCPLRQVLQIHLAEEGQVMLRAISLLTLLDPATWHCRKSPRGSLFHCITRHSNHAAAESELLTGTSQQGSHGNSRGT